MSRAQTLRLALGHQPAAILAYPALVSEWVKAGQPRVGYLAGDQEDAMYLPELVDLESLLASVPVLGVVVDLTSVFESERVR